MLESRCHGLLTTVIACGPGTDPAGRGAAAAAAGAGSRRTASKSSRPADAWDGSNVVVAIAANSYPSSTLSNLDESITPGTVGTREPADAGTTIRASVAMSAARATTLGSRTTGATLAEICLRGRGQWSYRAAPRTMQPHDDG